MRLNHPNCPKRWSHDDGAGPLRRDLVGPPLDPGPRILGRRLREPSPRGKKYAEDGQVSHFGVDPGEIHALVHGRKTYEVTLALPALTSAQWEKALARIAQESRFVASCSRGDAGRPG